MASGPHSWRRLRRFCLDITLGSGWRESQAWKELSPDLRIFLSQSYDLKAVADCETGPSAKVSVELAGTTIETGKRFVARMVELIERR
jgi:hypothetical protein